MPHRWSDRKHGWTHSIYAIRLSIWWILLNDRGGTHAVHDFTYRVASWTKRLSIYIYSNHPATSRTTLTGKNNRAFRALHPIYAHTHKTPLNVGSRTSRRCLCTRCADCNIRKPIKILYRFYYCYICGLASRFACSIIYNSEAARRTTSNVMCTWLICTHKYITVPGIPIYIHYICNAGWMRNLFDNYCQPKEYI